MSPAARVLKAIANDIRPLLPTDRRARLDHALSRAETGRVRVLVLGEAKRGKSTLVNALFDRNLLPTGALPVTSVGTSVTVGSPARAEVHFQASDTQAIELSEMAAFVSEHGNPGNSREVDTVTLTAPSPHLPDGTEVVDTPGTGSVHTTNTDEAARARACVDLAVLVVSADPPVSAAEVNLAAEVMATAAAAAVVVNKTDLVASSDVDAIVEFTRAAVQGPFGPEVPVLPISLRTGTPSALIEWLCKRITEHGKHDVVTSTGRALRREISAVRDGLLVEQDLLDRTDEDRDATAASLKEILDHARAVRETALDHICGQAHRARTRLDADHETQVTAALSAARTELGPALPHLPKRPEEAATEVRVSLDELAGQRCTKWFNRAGSELHTCLTEAAHRALAGLVDDLSRARHTAANLLDLQLEEVAAPNPGTLPPPPQLALGQDAVWRELITSTLVEHFPPTMRRKRLYRQLRSWIEHAVPRPFGRARSSLQTWLESATRQIERTLDTIWDEQLAALECGLAEVVRHKQAPASAEHHANLATNLDTLEHALRETNHLLDSHSSIHHGSHP